MNMNDLSKREQAEFVTWLNSLVDNAEVIEGLQDALARSPEFVALMTAYKQAPSNVADEFMRAVAYFAVLFLTKK